MPAAITIAVGTAGKVGDGVNAYYVYPVTSTAPAQEPLRVDRRYSDFLWLHHQVRPKFSLYYRPVPSGPRPQT